jgi:branched-chain amino acid transport system ATP-binding protein
LAGAEAILALEDVHTYYGDSWVLQGVSLAVERGAIVALLGRNGMGKTTVIRSIAGLTRPRRGAITFKETPLVGRSPHAIAQLGIGLVPQGRRIFPSLTVRENLMLAASSLARARGGRGARGERWTLDAVLADFPNLAERIGHRALHLSGGEQQMLAIGRALMANPDLILMDEPSEGLAPVLVERLAEILRGLRAHGHSVLLVEQNVSFALAVADCVYVLVTGRVVHEASGEVASRVPEAIGALLGMG